LAVKMGKISEQEGGSKGAVVDNHIETLKPRVATRMVGQHPTGP